MRRPFRIAEATRLSADQIMRQSRVMQAALTAFPSSAEVIAFLNTPGAEETGTPLQTAIASSDGLRAVEQQLHALAKREDLRRSE